MPANGNKKKETSSSSNSTFTIGDIVSSIPLIFDKVTIEQRSLGSLSLKEPK